jgi:hypothetical protein
MKTKCLKTPAVEQNETGLDPEWRNKQSDWLSLTQSQLSPAQLSSAQFSSVVMSHLQTSTLETALDVKALINLGAIKNTLQKKVMSAPAHENSSINLPNRRMKTNLITSNLSSNIIQRLNNPQTQFLPLLPLLNSNILNMSDQSQLMDKLALDDQTARSDDTVVPVTDDQHVILVVAGGDPVESGIPCFLADVADGCQHAQDVQVAPVEV